MALRLFLVLACTFLLFASREPLPESPGLSGLPDLGAAGQQLLAAVCMAAAGVVFYGLVRRRGASPRAAVLLTLVCALSTSCFTYVRHSVVISVQTLVLLLFVKESLRAAEKPAMGRILRVAPLAALILWHLATRTGPAWSFSALGPGLYGLFFSTGKSVFLYSPPLVLVPLSLGSAWREKRLETAFLLALIAVGLGSNARLLQWQGDHDFGPREAVPFVPLAMLLLVPWLPAAMSRGHMLWRRYIVALLCALGLAVQLVGAAFHWENYYRLLEAFQTQTGTAGFFQARLGHAHYLPQFSPLRGQWWLLSHKLRGDANLQAMHAAHSFLAVWDNHDLADPLPQFPLQVSTEERRQNGRATM